MRKKVFIQSILVVLMVLLIAGCAAWTALTPQEKARTVVDGIQEQVGDMFDASKDYVTLNPEYTGEWKVRIAPAFNLANKTLKEVAELASMELITPDEIRKRMTPLVNSIIRYLGEIGFFD